MSPLGHGFGRVVGCRDGVKVRLVDGEALRDHDISFTMGTNAGRAAYVPRNEVWVEKILSPRDREATILHELTERARMLGRGESYDVAHEHANAVEKKYRASHKRRAS